MKHPLTRSAVLAALALTLTTIPAQLRAADQPQWGEAWSRNLASNERGLPDSFDPESGKNIFWTAKLGTESHGTPIIAGGRVFIGTNNAEPRDPKHEGDRGALMCFDEKDGRFLWQMIVPKIGGDPLLDYPNSGLCSPATVEDDRVYIVSNRGEVLCLDVHGMANGNDGPFKDEGVHMALRGAPAMVPGPTDADIIWMFDMAAEAGIWTHDGAHSSILIRGPHLYLNTGTGVDSTHKRIRTPDAPSLIVLDKETGRYLARDDEKIAPRIFHATWSAPSMGSVNGQERIFFLGGDGILYGFEPLPLDIKVPGDSQPPHPLKAVWRFDPDPTAPKENVHRYNGNRRQSPSNFYGMPVFVDGHLFIAGGGDIFWGKNEAFLKRVDPTKADAAEVWSCALEKHVLGTPAIANGLAFIADSGRTFHCVDAKTGERLWTHDVKGEVWASPLVADGKVYLGTRGGQFLVLAAAREKQVLSSIELRTPISASAVAANGTLYVSTMTHLYALRR